MKLFLAAFFILGCSAAPVTDDAGDDAAQADAGADTSVTSCVTQGAGFTCTTKDVNCSACPTSCTVQGVAGICKTWP